MGIRTRMTSRPSRVREDRENLTEKLFREERDYRADRLVEKWSNIPEIGVGIQEMEPRAARNLAILLENQTRQMKHMTEAAIASNFNGQTPENMLRLVRLSYPNSIRGELFTEFAMETANDSIKYIVPSYQDKEGVHDKFDDGKMPAPIPGKYANGTAMYENMESRYATELHSFEKSDSEMASASYEAFTTYGTSKNLGTYLPGDSVIYGLKEGKKIGVAAVQDKDGEWVPSDFAQARVSGADKYLFIGRYDSELDFEGQNLGEVELVMRSYQFQPRVVSLGVTWTQLAELTLDTSFGVSAEEMMLDSAAQEIKKTLDYQAVKMAAAYQKKLAAENYAEFNAEASVGTKDSYWHTAQLVEQSIEQVANKQLDAIGRGGVTAIVGGPKAVTYLKLNEKFEATGAQPAIGGHKVGKIGDVDVYKVPSSIIAEDELLTVWKNPTVEADVAVAIGTLLPFYSTGAIQRKNLYKEGAVARFEDTQVLNPNYLGRIKINNIR